MEETRNQVEESRVDAQETQASQDADTVQEGVQVDAPSDVQVSVVNINEDAVERALRQAIAFYQDAIRLYGTPDDPMSPVWRLRERRWALEGAERDLQEYLDEKEGRAEDVEEYPLVNPDEEPGWGDA